MTSAPTSLLDRAGLERPRLAKIIVAAASKAPTTANCSSNTASPRCWCSTTAA